MKTLFIFDFDDTLALTRSHVTVTSPGQDPRRLSSKEFAKYEFNPDDDLDFSEFMTVKKGASLIDSTVEDMQKAMQSQGRENVYIVTARSIAAPVEEFLRNLGIDYPEVVATTGSANKAKWLTRKLFENDYQKVVVYEDCKNNIQMLKDVVAFYNNQSGENILYDSVCVVINETLTMTLGQLRNIVRRNLL